LNDAEISKKERYLRLRREHMQYPTFRRNGWPIGSGMVESGNKVVMQARLKGAGMRWHRTSVNLMLALRMALCNHRWHENWQHQGKHQHQVREQQRWYKHQHQVREQQRWYKQQQRVAKRLEKKKELQAALAPPPPPPSPAPKKGRTEAQNRWGRQTFSPRLLRQG
jgi:hypothetical protein